MKVICATVDCKHNDKYLCTLDEISLSDHSIVTVWEGRQHFWRCKNYEENEQSKRIKEILNEANI